MWTTFVDSFSFWGVWICYLLGYIFFPAEIVSLFSPLDRLLLAYRVQLTFFLCGFFLSCNITKFNHSKQLVVESWEVSLHVTMSSENRKLNYILSGLVVFCLLFLPAVPGWDLQCFLLGVKRPVILVLFLILSFEFFSTQYDVLAVGFSYMVSTVFPYTFSLLASLVQRILSYKNIESC